MFTQLLLMTQSLKPRPVYKKQVTRKTKTMTEQTRPSLQEPYVQSHLSDIQLISRDALLNDFKKRMEINNREVSYAWADFKKVLTEANKLASPYVNKAVTKVKDFRSNLSS